MAGQEPSLYITSEDIIRVCRHSPGTRVVVVHMDSFNHCLLSRKELRDCLTEEGLLDRVFVPEDGDWMEFN